MTDNARPEELDPQRDADALSGLPDDSRVHIDDIEWPDLDWSDSDELPPTSAPPPALRLVVPAHSLEPASEPTPQTAPVSLPGPAEQIEEQAVARPSVEGRPATTAPSLPGPQLNGTTGEDWRAAVPFWLRKPEPESTADELKDWRAAVPFWLRTPDGAPSREGLDANAAPVDAGPTDEPQPSAEPELVAEVHPANEPEPLAELIPTPRLDPIVEVRPATEPQPVGEAQPQSGTSHAADSPSLMQPGAPVSEPDAAAEAAEEDLTPLPGTTGEAVFFPPSSRRSFGEQSASSAASARPAQSPEEPSRPRPAASGAHRSQTARPPATRTADGSFSQPVAPYAQYDAADPGWDRIHTNTTGSGASEPSSQLDRRVPPTPSAREPRPNQARRRWLVRGAVIGSVIGALVVSLVVVLVTQGRFNSVNGTITGAPTGAPEAVVTGYLNALAHNDSQQALGFAKLRPADQRLLTDEVLMASNKAAPLRQVDVHTTELTDYRAQVDATYLIGTHKVTQSFTVYAVGAEWKLYDVARKMDLSQLKTGDLPLTLNGISISPDNVELFPGLYQVATTDDRYRVTKDSFLVSSPAAAPELGEVQLELSSTGVSQIAAAAVSRLSRCLAAHELQPAGCGFGAVAPKGTAVRLETMRWKATKGLDSLKMLHPTLDPGNPRLATAEVLIQVSGTAKDTKGGNLGVVDSIKTVRAGLGANSIEITLD